MLGVVGTRRPTPYGMAAAERLSGDLARAGLTIVSGMARGIDTAAHKGGIGGRRRYGRGAGLRRGYVYPSENRKLAAEIGVEGADRFGVSHGLRRLSRKIFPSATASSAG